MQRALCEKRNQHSKLLYTERCAYTYGISKSISVMRKPISLSMKSFRKIAAVLGMSARELVEEEVEWRAREVDEMAFGELVEQFFVPRGRRGGRLWD